MRLNVSKKIIENEKFQMTDIIELQVCNVGASPIPQWIADDTGKPVKAYGGYYFPGLGTGAYPKIFYPHIYNDGQV